MGGRIVKPGDTVQVIGGRHKGSKGKLVEIADTPGPSGSTYRIAEITRPRAGKTFVFEHEIAKLP